MAAIAAGVAGAAAAADDYEDYYKRAHLSSPNGTKRHNHKLHREYELISSCSVALL